MAQHNYGLSTSDEVCEDIAEISLMEENYPTSPAYDKRDKLTALDVFEDSATKPPKPLIVPHNKKFPPLPPSHGSPAVWSQSSHNEIPSPEPLSLGPPAVRVSHDERLSPVPSANGLPELLDSPPPPYSLPIDQVKLLLLKLRKI